MCFGHFQGNLSWDGGVLCDKSEGFVGKLTKVGKRLDDTKSEYKGAMNMLVDGRVNIITSIEKLKKNGCES